MRMKMLVLSTLALVMSVPLALIAEAQGYAPRQYYSSWYRHPKKTYYYRTYYYKPTPTYSGYKHHYVVYVPEKPKYYYYYSPYKKQYWGRCPSDHGGKPVYSQLAEKDRKATLDEIPESAFPAPAPLPPLPESNDGATLDLPPDDLPSTTPGDSLPN